MYRRLLAASLTILIVASAASAQRADITINLDEAFFDALLDSVYQNFNPPEFTLGQNFGWKNRATDEVEGLTEPVPAFSFANYYRPQPNGFGSPACTETVKILREMNGVRTAVRMREGKILVPLAFSGSYAPPFVGCVDFAGVAEANIDLEFDREGQRLIGRAHVLNVNLNGTGGLGGSIIAKMLQGSIDKKLNPIEILTLDKVSFMVPIQNAGKIRMKAVSVTPEVLNGSISVRITYDFLKG